MQGGFKPAIHALDVKNTRGGADGQCEGEKEKNARGGECQRTFGVGAVDQKDQQTISHDHNGEEAACRIEGVFEHEDAPFMVIHIMYHKYVFFSMGYEIFSVNRRKILLFLKTASGSLAAL